MTNERHEKALEAVEPEWIEWMGGECPVPETARVDVRYREYCMPKLKNFEAWDVIAGREFWDHRNHREDIIAYRVVPNHFTNGE